MKVGRLLPLIFLVGCTQTATILEPLTYGCRVSCAPGEVCKAEFYAVDEVGTDKSVLLDGIELGRGKEQ